MLNPSQEEEDAMWAALVKAKAGKKSKSDSKKRKAEAAAAETDAKKQKPAQKHEEVCTTRSRRLSTGACIGVIQRVSLCGLPGPLGHAQVKGSDVYKSLFLDPTKRAEMEKQETFTARAVHRGYIA